MKPETKNDMYDLMDLLNKLFSVSFLKDKERLNEMRDALMASMESERAEKEKNKSGEIVSEKNRILESEDEETGLYTMQSMRQLLKRMSKIRKKDAMADFLKELDIKPYDTKLSLKDMRGRALEELILRSEPAPETKMLVKEKSAGKAKKKKEDGTEKKDFMDMWLDFYRKSREHR